MAKQVIINALEEVLGEYVLNLDEENLRVAALRGKIKLENVQLDGDLLGGYVLGSMMGLSGFGTLSCFAKSVKITIPSLLKNNFDSEPTLIEMRGCHLLCLPLLPSTAHKKYGAGTVKDPYCTLRTRAKRSKLARFEKNYMSGRIPGEGPVAKRILRAVEGVEKDLLKKSKKKRRSANRHYQNDSEDEGGDSDSDAFTQPESSAASSAGDDDSFADWGTESGSSLPELPRDWKVKLRERLMRNLQASMHDIHVRCEVSEGGLDFCHPDNNRKRPTNSSDKVYDQRAFAFGATLDDFVVRTANENWEVGSHVPKKRKNLSNDHLGPNPYDERNNKLITWKNFSVYWDDDPPFLLSETSIIRSRASNKMSTDKFHTKLAAAMAAMYKDQEPGTKIRESLYVGPDKKRADLPTEEGLSKPHQYCWEDFNYEVRSKTSDRTEPGPVSCLFELIS